MLVVGSGCHYSTLRSDDVPVASSVAQNTGTLAAAGQLPHRPGPVTSNFGAGFPAASWRRLWRPSLTSGSIKLSSTTPLTTATTRGRASPSRLRTPVRKDHGLRNESRQYSATMTRIGLALGGGGYRAAEFALGVVHYLNDVGRLDDVVAISSVSGGSITNGFLGTRLVEDRCRTATERRQQFAMLSSALANQSTISVGTLTGISLAILLNLGCGRAPSERRCARVVCLSWLASVAVHGLDRTRLARQEGFRPSHDLPCRWRLARQPGRVVLLTVGERFIAGPGSRRHGPHTQSPHRGELRRAAAENSSGPVVPAPPNPALYIDASHQSNTGRILDGIDAEVGADPSVCLVSIDDDPWKSLDPGDERQAAQMALSAVCALNIENPTQSHTCGTRSLTNTTQACVHA
jgi:hypothetical protein